MLTSVIVITRVSILIILPSVVLLSLLSMLISLASSLVLALVLILVGLILVRSLVVSIVFLSTSLVLLFLSGSAPLIRIPFSSIFLISILLILIIRSSRSQFLFSLSHYSLNNPCVSDSTKCCFISPRYESIINFLKWVIICALF